MNGRYHKHTCTLADLLQEGHHTPSDDRQKTGLLTRQCLAALHRPLPHRGNLVVISFKQDVVTAAIGRALSLANSIIFLCMWVCNVHKASSHHREHKLAKVFEYSPLRMICKGVSLSGLDKAQNNSSGLLGTCGFEFERLSYCLWSREELTRKRARRLFGVAPRGMMLRVFPQ